MLFEVLMSSLAVIWCQVSALKAKPKYVYVFSILQGKFKAQYMN